MSTRRRPSHRQRLYRQLDRLEQIFGSDDPVALLWGLYDLEAAFFTQKGAPRWFPRVLRHLVIEHLKHEKHNRTRSVWSTIEAEIQDLDRWNRVREYLTDHPGAPAEDAYRHVTALPGMPGTQAIRKSFNAVQRRGRLNYPRAAALQFLSLLGACDERTGSL